MYYVYILCNQKNSVLYVGMTGNLKRRIAEHKKEQIEGFTKRYHIHKLIYFERYREVSDALSREKEIKHWLRRKKIALIESQNPSWIDLWEQL